MLRLVFRSLCAAVFVLQASAWAEAGPLPQAQAAALAGIAQDPAPKVLLGQAPGLENKHYLIGNEWHLELYNDKLKNLGGLYAGVGSDQAYFLIGMVRPEVAVLTDYDDLVVQLHQIYLAFFRAATTPAGFLKLWSEAGQADALAALQAHCPAADLPNLTKLYKVTRGKVGYRLGRVGRTFHAAKVESFVRDPGAYDFIRGLVVNGRVRAVRIDLLAAVGVPSLAQAAKAMQLPVRALYLSNAENYWAYSSQFKSNMAALPVDDKSLIVRTVSTWDHNFDYLYHTQPSRNYLAWLAKDWVKGYRMFVQWKRPEPGQSWAFHTAPDVDSAERMRTAKVKKPKAKSTL